MEWVDGPFDLPPGEPSPRPASGFRSSREWSGSFRGHDRPPPDTAKHRAWTRICSSHDEGLAEREERNVSAFHPPRWVPSCGPARSSDQLVVMHLCCGFARPSDSRAAHHTLVSVRLKRVGGPFHASGVEAV